MNQIGARRLAAADTRGDGAKLAAQADWQLTGV
jgi:hypothetical protein